MEIKPDSNEIPPRALNWNLMKPTKKVENFIISKYYQSFKLELRNSHGTAACYTSINIKPSLEFL